MIMCCAADSGCCKVTLWEATEFPDVILFIVHGALIRRIFFNHSGKTKSPFPAHTCAVDTVSHQPTMWLIMT